MVLSAQVDVNHFVLQAGISPRFLCAKPGFRETNFINPHTKQRTQETSIHNVFSRLLKTLFTVPTHLFKYSKFV